MTRAPARDLPTVRRTLCAVDSPRVRVLAWVDCTTEGQVARAQEVLSRAATGLALEGIRAHVVVDPDPHSEDPHP